MTNSSRRRWSLSFKRSSSSSSSSSASGDNVPPPEFICPIAGTLMFDPVIVSSGHSFDRVSVTACISLAFIPAVGDGAAAAAADFSAIIPNLALKSAILTWCAAHFLPSPHPVDLPSAVARVRSIMASSGLLSSPDLPPLSPFPPTTASPPELDRRRRSSSFCTSSSSEIETLISPEAPISPEQEEILSELVSRRPPDQAAAASWLRNTTRMNKETRKSFCTSRFLSPLKHLIAAGAGAAAQADATAAVVNISLEWENKGKIVRSGMIPALIEALRSDSIEVQEHAAGALFSLALHDGAKAAIGALGGLPALLRALRSRAEMARRDSALALRHLSTVQTNRAKLAGMGGARILLNMVGCGEMTRFVLPILCNMAAYPESRGAVLESGGVGVVVGVLGEGRREERDGCVGVMYGLSGAGVRFRVLARAAGAAEVLSQAVEAGDERVRQMAARVLETMRRREEGEEEVDWEGLLEEEFPSCSRVRALLPPSHQPF